MRSTPDTTTPLQPVSWLARRLGLSMGRAYELARTNAVPAVRIGRQIRVDPVAIERWIADGGHQLPGGWRKEPANEIR